MTDWTTTANDRLERWLDSMVSKAPPEADPQEIREDLRAHVMLEVEGAGLALVTEDDVRRITARLGEVEGATGEPAAPDRPAARRPGSDRAKSELEKPAVSVVLFGVLLPIGALLVELSTHTWSGVFVNPIPTPLHVLAIVAVAAINALCLYVSSEALANRPRLWATLNGFAIGVPILYALIFLPSLPLAAFGLIFLLGIFPLSPYLAVIAGLRARRWIARGAPARRILGVPPVLLGIAAAFVILLAPEVHAIVTANLIARAAADDPEKSLSAVRMLRRFGDESTMIAAARGDGGDRRATLLPTGILARRLLPPALAGSRTPAEAASRVWYRVTGRRLPDPEDERGFSDFLARDAAFFRRDLRLTASRIDGTVDAAGSNVYFEWTLTFRNEGPGDWEATAELALPPGGVVSRATLWVDGEERDAAFAGRAEATKAYEGVVARRRDPLLVTASGTGRVSIRGYPVVADKDFQIRIGVTAPLVLDSSRRGAILLPRFADRNFKLGTGVRHSVWIESPAPFRDHPGFVVDETPARRYSARAQIADGDGSAPQPALFVESAAPEVAVAKDLLTPQDQKVVVQRIVTAPASRPSRIVVVVDGGASMKEHIADVVDAVASIPDGYELGVIYGGEEIVDVGGGCRRSSHASVKEAAANLGRQEPVGGTDAVAALVRGLELASESRNAALVWVHAGVPKVLSSASELMQAIERRPDNPKIYDLAVTEEPDEVSRGFPSTHVRRIHRLGTLAMDLGRLLDCWAGTIPELTYDRRRVATEAIPDGAASATAHVGRLWASDSIDELSFPVRAAARAEALALARTFQLVTPVSGAVVLEAAEQYAAANLQPIDPSTAPDMSVPSVPEPHEWALLCVAALAFAWLLWRRRPRARYA
jgi:hypothetical protein